MKSYRKEVWLQLPTRRGFVNITPQIQECLRESGVREGLALVNSMHVTAAVFVDDDEQGLYRYYEMWLERLAPVVPIDPSLEDTIGADIIDAHMKRQLMGREVVVAVTEGRLDFGQWENIFYGEFDGGRRKRVLVKIIGE
jgi:secondary thiamine-phosphate synthase enzyme